MADWGWENGFSRAGWERALQEFRVDPAFTPLLMEYYRRLKADDGVALARTDLLTDPDWYRSAYFTDIHSAIGVDHTLHCYRRTGGGVFTSVTLARPPRDRDFTRRQAAVVAEVQRAVAGWVGGPLARFREPSPSDLTPRVRQVLGCLLEGDSDKQVAARLRLSKHTVNQYVKVIFAHFGVNTRPELLARWVRRRWGVRRGWLDGGTAHPGPDVGW